MACKKSLWVIMAWMGSLTFLSPVAMDLSDKKRDIYYSTGPIYYSTGPIYYSTGPYGMSNKYYEEELMNSEVTNDIIQDLKDKIKNRIQEGIGENPDESFLSLVLELHEAKEAFNNKLQGETKDKIEILKTKITNINQQDALSQDYSNRSFIRSISKEKELCEKQLNELEDKLKKLKNLRGPTKEKMDKYRKDILNSFEEINNTIQDIEFEMNEIQEGINKDPNEFLVLKLYEEKEAFKKKLNKIKPKIEYKMGALKAIIKQNNEIIKEYSEQDCAPVLIQENKLCEKQLKELEDKLKALEDKINESKEKELEDKIKELKDKIKELKDSKDDKIKELKDSKDFTQEMIDGYRKIILNLIEENDHILTVLKSKINEIKEDIYKKPDEFLFSKLSKTKAELDQAQEGLIQELISGIDYEKLFKDKNNKHDEKFKEFLGNYLDEILFQEKGIMKSNSCKLYKREIMLTLKHMIRK